MDIFFEKPDCSFSILFIIINVVIKLYELNIFSQSPSPNTISMEIVLIALEIQKLLIDEIKMPQSSLKISLF
jgi:hypothetical protein